MGHHKVNIYSQLLIRISRNSGESHGNISEQVLQYEDETFASVKLHDRSNLGRPTPRLLVCWRSSRRAWYDRTLHYSNSDCLLLCHASNKYRCCCCCLIHQAQFYDVYPVDWVQMSMSTTAPCGNCLGKAVF